MNSSAVKVCPNSEKSAHAIGVTAPPIGCVLDLRGLPGAGNKIYDRSPYGNIGTITGAVWKFKNGLWVLSFDGVDDVINCGDNPSLDFTGSFTLMTWIKLGATGVNQHIMGRDDGVGRNYYLIIPIANKIGLTFFSSNVAKVVTGDTALDTTRWFFVAGVYNQIDLRVYKDGVLDCTPVAETGAVDNDDVAFSIGARLTTPVDRDLTGEIMLPRAFNRDLSALEIQNQYQSEKHLFGVV